LNPRSVPFVPQVEKKCENRAADGDCERLLAAKNGTCENFELEQWKNCEGKIVKIVFET
jgi:hypothetical protein